jgi:hypothetical protein
VFSAQGEARIKRVMAFEISPGRHRSLTESGNINVFVSSLPEATGRNRMKQEGDPL